jgi:pilus assembly protein Flp/PilA
MNIKKIFLDNRGATAIEYALIAGIISVGIIGALTLLGPKIQGLYSTISPSL